MSTQVLLRCRCGKVRGSALNVSPTTGKHINCMCDDCQAYARFLGREDILDEHGGTPIFQLTPAQVRITQGQEQLRCVLLVPKGMPRWYTDCCKTPVGNTMGPLAVPFVGMPLAFIDWENVASTPEQLLGKPVGLMAKFAKNGAPLGAHAKVPPSFMLSAVLKLTMAYLRGMAWPSPFASKETKTRIAPIQQLSAEERASLS